MERPTARWHFLSNHGAVLLYVALYPNATVREISEGVEITERATARILAQLREDGYVATARHGRRSSYTIASELHMRRAVTHQFSVAQLLAGFLDAASAVDRPESTEAIDVIKITAPGGGGGAHRHRCGRQREEEPAAPQDH